MTEEQIKEHLLANFCDGDSWEDAKADRFTHEGALEIAKYFHDEGFKAGSEQNNPTVEGTETEEEQIRKFTNRLSFGLHVSNDTMDAIRLFRKELPDFLQSTRADERKKVLSEAIAMTSPADAFFPNILPHTSDIRSRLQAELKAITESR